MASKKDMWVRGRSVCWCPRCLITVDPEQTYCVVCDYGKAETAGYDDFYDRDCSGLLEDE